MRRCSKRSLPGNKLKLFRLVRANTKREQAAIELVLDEFWSLEDGKWLNQRALKEIDKAAERAETNRKIALERETKRATVRATNRARTVAPTQIQSQIQIQKNKNSENISLMKEREDSQRDQTHREDPPPIMPLRVCPPSMRHAWCDGRVHVPLSLHYRFQRTAPEGFDLMEWYGITDKAWAAQDDRRHRLCVLAGALERDTRNHNTKRCSDSDVQRSGTADRESEQI